ncbi:MAG TPA: BatA domain-containing protein, partial [Isosphaeraceae bacterium]
MSWGVANAAMLLGLLGMAIPVIIHLLNRRRAVVVDWGAMQFLELGRRARRRINLTELLLMAGRMLLLGLVALALARPFWMPKPAGADAAGRDAGAGAGAQRRDVVLVLDGSASMGRRAGGTP